jgi:unsaturated rhamnogalacturonyl hydrolase
MAMKIDAIERYIDRLFAESTPACPLWNVERLHSGEKPKWNYIDGCMMSALMRMYERTWDERYYRFLRDYLNTFVDDAGGLLGYERETYNLDNIYSGNALIDAYRVTGEEKYKKAIDTLLFQLKDQPRTTEGNYWHKQIYPNQVWLDGLYMAQVFRARWEKYFGDGGAYEDILMQFQNVRKYMFDEDTKLYRHGYDASKKVFWADEEGLSQNVWLRSVGWYAAALADVIEVFPEALTEGRACLKSVLMELFAGMMPYLDKESGMFLQVVDYPRGDGNYPETSGSALLAFAMMKSARLGVADDTWKYNGTKLFHSICGNYLREADGGLSLGGICLSAGLGPADNTRRDGSYGYYISEPVVENEGKGIAPLLYCYAESLHTGIS